MAVGGDQRLRDSASVRLADTARREVLAALDLGTNNCRLLVARPIRGGFHVIDAYSRIVCLGEGLSASGCLSESAMERSLDALAVCAGKLRRRRVTRLRAVATEACRRAVTARTGVEVRSRRSPPTAKKHPLSLSADPCPGRRPFVFDLS